jgi:3-oxoacyl-[acyl-carrier protein] reductase
VVVVTGGSRGIGLAIVERLVARGVSVVAVQRSPQPPDADGVPWAELGTVTWLAGDLRHPSTADRAIEAAGELGELTGLVCNAGATDPGLVGATPVERFGELYELNTLASVRMVQRCARPMARRGGGGWCSSARSPPSGPTRARPPTQRRRRR